MRLIEIPVSGIMAYVSSDEFRNSPVIPISSRRALSQSLNPRGRPEDIILIIAYDEKERLTGFIGALPDQLSLVPDQHITWNSGWWVDPAIGREAAMPLFYRFLDRWQQKVLFADLTPLTYQIVCRTGFFEGRIRTGTRGYIRMPLSDILIHKNRIFRKMKWLFSAADILFNFFWEFRLGKWKNRNSPDPEIQYEFIHELNDEMIRMIRDESEKELIRRGGEEFRWIRNYPWIIQGKPGLSDIRYPFSSHASRFEQHWVKISRKQQPFAFLILTLRDYHLKIPYLYFVSGSLPGILDFLIHFMIDRKVRYISVFHKDLSEYIFLSRAPMIWKKRILRYSAVSKDLEGILPVDYVIQDGDGDVAFT